MPHSISFIHQDPAMLTNSKHRRRDRPKGLWKARATTSRCSARIVQERESPPNPSNFESDIGDDDGASSSSTSSEQRRSPSLGTSDNEEIYYWDYSRKCSPHPHRVSGWTTQTKIMDTSTIASSCGSSSEKPDFDYEDWEDLKELFSKATEQYESNEISEAAPVLRGVIHECHRFLLSYEDPSVLFVEPPSPPSNVLFTQLDENFQRDRSIISAPEVPSKECKCKCVDLPTAFHAILGTALFLFGNLIAQEPTLALAGEPDYPVPYWLAALDVFETGENLPSRINGLCGDVPEDWRMAIVWGRTLVCIADEAVTRAQKAKQTGSDSGAAEFLSSIAHEIDWPPESPFATIVARRLLCTQRMSLSTASPNDLMVLAMDQFSRGIFRMPHPRNKQSQQPPIITSEAVTGIPPIQTESFSRPKELFTIASEVLLLSEKLDIPSERQYWASWADSVFNQMKMEADMDAWRGPINRARGRCWLIVGSAEVEDIEAALERGEADVLKTEKAQEAREGLSTAISFFEHAKSSATVSALSDPESRELQSLLAEALLTLANLTVDESKRDSLYARAQLESGEDYDLLERQYDDDGDEVMKDE